MSDQWYYRMFGEEFGPMPIEKLKELAESGTIQALDQVRSNRTDWVAAATIDELGLSTSEQGNLAVAMDISDFEIAESEHGNINPSDTDVPTSISDFEMTTTTTVADEWFCMVGANELGPLSFDELLKFAEHEQLSADDQVKMGANGKWRRAGSIGRLMAALPYKSVEKKIVPQSKASIETVNVETRSSRTVVPAPQPVAAAPAPAPAVAAPDPDATYRVAYEQAKAMVMESMLAQADAAFKAAEAQAQSHIAWASAPNVDRYWWGWAGGVEFGPVEFAQVFGLAKSGQLKPSDFVRNGANGQFVPSSGVPGLFKALELIAKATEARTLAKTQAQAAAALVAPPTTAPTALLKAAEKSLAEEQAAKSNPTIPLAAAAPMVRSNPSMDAVRQQPRPVEPTAAPESSPRNESDSNPEPAADPNRSSYGSPAASGGYGGMGGMGGFSTSSSSSMSTYGSTKPAPYKPPVRKSSASSSTWFSDTLDSIKESLKEPKAMGAVGAIALVLLMVGWQYLPKNRSDDIKKYQVLKGLLDEVKTKRASAPAELAALQQKMTKIGKEIATELKDKASREDPAKQCLLWAARDEIPRLVQAGLGTESPAEQTLANRLRDASYELGLEKRPPVDLTQLAARNED